MIKAQRLGKDYGKITAVSDLTLNIAKGETMGLLGPNGAGKSTTINMLVGLIKPDRGEIHIGEEDSGRAGDPTIAAVRRRIGIAPQTLSLYEELTARENLVFFGGIYGLSGSRLKERARWCLDFAGLNERSGDRVQTFSGGMKRRLNIAAALMHEPEILMLDEPTVGVDPQSRNHIFDSIEILQSAGLTLIYTTHYMEEAQRLCDRVAIVDHGKLLALDTVDNLINKHGGDSVVTAELLDEFKPEAFAHDLIVDPQQNESTIRFASERPFDALAHLAKTNIQFSSLKMARPDLESVFLALTGRSLRD